MIGLLAAEIRPQTSPIFEIQNAMIRQIPTLICFHCSQPGLVDSVLDLSSEPNLLVPFILWSDYWLLRYSNKHPQFSEFRIPKSKNSPHWYAPTTDSQVRWIAYRTYSMRWISPCHPFHHVTHGCVATGTNITNFRNFKCEDERITNIDMLLPQTGRRGGSRTRPI